MMLHPLRLLSLALIASTPACAVAGTPELDAVFADASQGTRPGYAVAMFRDGEPLFVGTYGYADLDHAVPITPQTVFHIASLSKQFTAAAVAILLDEGVIALNDPLSKYVPEAAHFEPEVRIEHLVYMTSGLPEYGSRPRPGGRPWFSSFYFTTADAIAATLSADQLEFDPGTRWAYSNVNYMLLTRVVEEASGMPFAAFMRQRVFEPLGMDATSIDVDTTAVVPNRAMGYAARTPAVVAETASIGVTVLPGEGWARMLRVSPHYGGSGVMTSIDDLAKWDANWTEGTLGPGFAVRMHATRRFEHDKVDDAMGLVQGEFDGRRAYWYEGGDLDASSYMVRFPDDHLTIVCLSNLFEGDCRGRAMAMVDAATTRGWLRPAEASP